MSEKKSFWTSLPGILTGIAAIIAAVGGLYQIGVFSTRPAIQSSTNSSPSGVPPQPEPSPTGKEKLLEEKELSGLQPRAKREIQIPESIFRDPRTGLLWTRTDNGYDINWQRAVRYCKGLPLGGYTDWRLPEIKELAGIHDPNNVTGKSAFGDKDSEIHTISGFRLSTGLLWSATGDPADAWSFNFAFERPFFDPVGISHSYRAVCVRRSGE